MANLTTLDGISAARESLYNKLEEGAIDDRRATAMERTLRGQVDLKAGLPTRLLGIVVKFKGSQSEKYVAPLVRSLLKFTTGEEPPPLEAPKS